jgi:hypothetical protein
MHAKDTHENLSKAFSCYREQIKRYQDQTFAFTNGDGNEELVVIRIFLGGDYMFLCGNYGHPEEDHIKGDQLRLFC